MLTIYKVRENLLIMGRFPHFYNIRENYLYHFQEEFIDASVIRH